MLRDVHQALHKQPCVVITGGPGFGKSQIARQYAHLHNRAYDIIWWFKVDHTLSRQFEYFAAALNKILPPKSAILLTGASFDKIRADLKHTLRQQSKRCLFIFDNGQGFETLQPYMLDAPNTHMLVTTRRKIAPYKTLTVGKLQRTEALCLLTKYLPEDKSCDLNTLASYFADHPLALVTAASFLLSHPTLTTKAYLSSHKIRRSHEGEGALPGNTRNISATLKIALDTLEEENADACAVLKMLSLLGHAQIPFVYVKGFLHTLKSSQSDHDVLGILYGRSFIDIQKNNNPAHTRIAMHELIHQLTGAHLLEAEKRALLEKVIPVIAEFFEGRSDLVCKRIVAAPEHLIHAKRLFEEARQVNYTSLPLLILKIHVLDVILCTFRDFEQAKVLLDDIAHDQAILKENAHAAHALPPADHALLEVDKTFLRLYLADYDKAIVHGEKALALLGGLENTEEETIRMIANMSQNYILQGDLRQADALIEKGIPLLKTSQSDVYNAFCIRVVFLRGGRGT